MFRRRLRLCAAAATGLLIAAVAATPASTAARGVEDPVVDVTIQSFTPVAPKPGEPVRITGEVRNTSSVPLENPQAIVCLQRNRLATRAQLAAVPAEDQGPVNDQKSCLRLGGTAAFQAYDAPLQPNATVRFSLVLPWEQWQISDQPGVYVVGVQFRVNNPSDGSRVTAGRARTLMPVVSAKPLPRKVGTAVTLPLLHRPTLLGDNLFANDSLAQSLAPTGVLGRQLAAGRAKGVSWIVDPAMLDEVRRLADGYRVAGARGRAVPGTGQKAAKDWLAAFNASRARNPVILLPYGDPDVAGLIDAGGPLRELVGRARETTAATTLGGAKPFRSGIWLEPGSATGRNLGTASTGYAAIRSTDVNLVPSSAWNPADRPAPGASPVRIVPTPDSPRQQVRTVISDSALTAGGPDPGSAGSALQVRQRFAAETSLLALTGTAPLTVVASVPRTPDSDGSTTTGLLAGLSLPWITPLSIEQVLETEGNQAPTAEPAKPARPASTLTGSRLDEVKKLNNSIDVFTSLLTNPDSVTGNLTPWLLRATSLGWRGWGREAQAFTGNRQRAIDSQLGNDSQLGKVHLVRPNGPTQGTHRDIKVNLSGSKGQFPLTVENELDQSVRIGIRVQSVNRSDLRIEPLSTVTLKAKGKATFNIQASAEQNGLIRARAQVVSADGEPVGPTQDLVVEAAEYGSVGWILVGAAVALLFGTSLVRIYRRIRSERRNPAATQPAGPDPLNPPPLNPTASSAGDPSPAGAEADEDGPRAVEPNPLDPVPASPARPRANGVPDTRDNGVRENGQARDGADDVPRNLREGVGTKDG